MELGGVSDRSLCFPAAIPWRCRKRLGTGRGLPGRRMQVFVAWVVHVELNRIHSIEVLFCSKIGLHERWSPMSHRASARLLANQPVGDNGLHLQFAWIRLRHFSCELDARS